jgi:hypothetical protein
MSSWIIVGFDEIFDGELKKLKIAARFVYASRRCKLQRFEDEDYKELKRKVEELNMNAQGENLYQVMKLKNHDYGHFLDLQSFGTATAVKNVKRHVKKAKKKDLDYFYIHLNDGPSHGANIRAIKNFAESNGFAFSGNQWDEQCYLMILHSSARYIQRWGIFLLFAGAGALVLIVLMLLLSLKA